MKRRKFLKCLPVGIVALKTIASGKQKEEYTYENLLKEIEKEWNKQSNKIWITTMDSTPRNHSNFYTDENSDKWMV